MKSKQLTRVGVALFAGALALAAFVPAVSAAAPNWTMTVTPQVNGDPSSTATGGSVSSGGVQGFQVVITNNGPSNISTLYLVDSVADAPQYINIDAASSGTYSTAANCVPSGRILCNFGAVNAGTSITVMVAYTVPFTNPAGSTITFELNTTGNVPGKNNSHGDALDVTETVALLTGKDNPDNGASFVIPTTSSTVISDSQTLGPKNLQGTTVTVPGGNSRFGVTVQDGTGVTATCTNCGSLIGQWSKISVNGGSPVTGGFKVTLLIDKSQFSGSLDPTTVVAYHVLDNGTTEKISTQCTFDSGNWPTNFECVHAQKDGSKNLILDVYLLKNGVVRGGAN